MAKNFNLRIHFPVGNPINLKTSRDATICQVLKEVCPKMSLDPDEYDLKYERKILDIDTTIRYNVISNFARLDVVKSDKPRSATKVTICVQLEDGSRKNAPFSPSVNLQQVLKDLSIEYDEERAVIVYTKKEVLSKDFETVSLSSMGLNKGSALLRLLHRDPEKAREQAHVYTFATPKVSKVEFSKEDEVSEPVPVPSVKPEKKTFFDPISAIRKEKGIIPKVSKEQGQSESTKTVAEEACAINVTEPETNKETEEIFDDVQNKESAKIVEEKPKMYYLNKERKALLFNQALMQKSAQKEMSDADFEFTNEDRKLCQKWYQDQLKESPLLTAKLRESEREKLILENLEKYPKTVVKIFFDSQLVLQGVFDSSEPVSNLKDFVKTYLEDSTTDFSLYMSPPRYYLNDQKTLVEEGLPPGAIVYYSGSSDIHPEFKAKLTDPSIALKEAKPRLNGQIK